MPPMDEKLRTRRGEATQWMSKGAFERSVLGSSDRRVRVDIARLVMTLLALNFLPAVALWHYDTIRDWLHQKDLNTTVVRLSRAITILTVGGVLIAGVAYADKEDVLQTKVPALVIPPCLQKPRQDRSQLSIGEARELSLKSPSHSLYQLLNLLISGNALIPSRHRFAAQFPSSDRASGKAWTAVLRRSPKSL
jgi:hypothetical protein